MNNIDHFDKFKAFFVMVLIQQNLLNINDVLGIVLSTKDIKINKTGLSKIDLKELAGMTHRYDK